MLRYDRAACNDLRYIFNLLKENPELIDVGCPEENQYYDSSAAALKMTGVSILGVIGITLFPPAGIYILLSELAVIAQQGNILVNKTRSRLGWTLLDYAGESGAISVAVFLILKGANTEDKYFLKLAESNRHKEFVNVCSMLMMMVAPLKTLEARHTEEIRVLQAQIKQYESALLRANNIIEQLLPPIENKEPAVSQLGFYSQQNDNNVVNSNLTLRK